MIKADSSQVRRAASADNFASRIVNSEPNGNGNGNNKRERILAAGLRLFANETYQAVTMDRVAEAAGVAKGTLYLYFPSKEALYLGILGDGLETVSKRSQANNDSRRDVGERLRRAIEV